MSKRIRAFWMLAFVAAFLIATFAVSQLTSVAPRVVQGTASSSEALIGLGYLAVASLSVLILGRMMYSIERNAGRVKRRVKLFE